MGADIKALRTRIKSVSSTLHLTKAMGLVASSKIRRANEHMLKSRQYAAAVEETVRLLAACGECRKSPYMRQGGDKTMLVVIAGDRGLAGGYNANILKAIEADAAGSDYCVLPIGKKAVERFERRKANVLTTAFAESANARVTARARTLSPRRIFPMRMRLKRRKRFAQNSRRGSSIGSVFFAPAMSP